LANPDHRYQEPWVNSSRGAYEFSEVFADGFE